MARGETEADLGLFMNPLDAATASKVALSSNPDDPGWDEFLESNPLGHYQQSTAWARSKKAAGWEPLRCAATRGGAILGGFQVLHRQTRLGRVGYLSKGPVVLGERGEILSPLVEALRRQSDDAGLAALIVQPPDDSRLTAGALLEKGFKTSPYLGIIASTLVLPLDGGMEAIQRRMNRETRRRIRQARERGLAVREGDEADLQMFFGLMTASCRRQGSARPNPSSLEELRAVWEAFNGEGKIRLTLAEMGGSACAGLICIAFGKRVSLWKKGWAEGGRGPGANYLLYADAISWSERSGYFSCDFESLKPDIAESMVRGRDLSPGQRRSRDYFNIRFGGAPKILPPAMVFIPNPLLSQAFSAVGSMRSLMGFARGLFR